MNLDNLCEAEGVWFPMPGRGRREEGRGIGIYMLACLFSFSFYIVISIYGFCKSLEKERFEWDGWIGWMGWDQ